ncbi:YicC/YloC family endoribonuclease [Carnobacterium gallinarum]|uniref:YicC/YloC family endoribonuclease n=1 Tax=Carnobacterium gallinarum TaxID=2749 RepID=UPI00055560AC|nr:YicC/YloC family endoribonuclease [Carnobacterium gallinarum]
MKSMTGFGRASISRLDYQIDIEIKSINHRFLEIVARMPKELNFMELPIKKQLGSQLKRGRVEVYVNFKKSVSGQKELVVNWSLVDEAVHFVTEAKERYAAQPDIDFSASLPQLFASDDFLMIQEQDLDEATIEPLISEAAEAALAELVLNREAEGLRLKEHLLNHVAAFKEAIGQIVVMTDLFEAHYRTRLENRLNEVLGNLVDEPRLLTELAVLLEKADIHEELERLDSHVIHLTKLLEKQEPVGRELDFLIQEMNREVNTIGSKANQLKLSDTVILMKTELEKIREQVQNIE